MLQPPQFLTSLFLLMQVVPQQVKPPQSPHPPPVVLLLVLALPVPLVAPPAPVDALVVLPPLVAALTPVVPVAAVVPAPPAPPVVTSPPHPSGRIAVKESASVSRSIRSMMHLRGGEALFRTKRPRCRDGLSSGPASANLLRESNMTSQR